MIRMNESLSKKILFVGGKGGVGKSTSAAALAYSASRSRQKTLLISTDPAHNVGDLFHMEVGSEKTKIDTNLWALEIDPQLESKRYIDSVKENLKELVKADRIEEVHRQIDTASVSPGAEEAALFDRMVTIILDETKNFDRIIFDTAPTGHTIRLLSLPELMGVWIEGMLEKRQKINENYTQLLNDGEPVEDPIYQVLQKRKEKFASVRNIMLDKNQTGFIFVLIPERLPILETEKGLKLLEQYDLHVETLIVNKVLPEEADGEFLKKRKNLEKEYLHLLTESFKGKEIIQIPLFAEDISSLDRLKSFADYLENN